ncbi:MAG TPA: very short patch repair endonuclease [Patescibacteria group bacterium]|nr:very short patch repair endonuclease [Patescibacteria group bacterium]
MADHVSPQKRSLIMAAVHSEGTTPEKAVHRILRQLGFRSRMHVRALPGCPDFVFPSLRKVMFVHGCFWHRHPRCRYTTTPKTRRKFWQAKFEANVARDRRVRRQLRRMGWAVMTVWQCQLKKPNKLTERLNDFLSE